MTENRLQALAVLGVVALFFAVASFLVTALDVDLIYRCALVAVILGATFLLGIVLSLPGVKQITEAAAKWVKRNSRKILITVVGLLILAAAWLFVMENGHRFLARHRTELFWLVFFPGMFLLPYFYAVVSSRLRSKSRL